MQSFTAGVANTLYADLVSKLDGEPIVAGTVNFYLIALTGANAGRWFKTSDDSWSLVEAIAGVATHKSDGHWYCEIDAAAFLSTVRYRFYAKESGDLHFALSEEITEATVALGITVTGISTEVNGT